MANQCGEMMIAFLRHQSAARYVLESPVHLKKFFDYIQLLNSNVAADDALTLMELIDKEY
jgi:calcium binding protein 39